MIHLTCSFIWILLGFSTLEITDPKPIKIYQKEDVTIKAYNFEGIDHLLQQQNDTTYLVNFWATWCMPCVEELPYFEKVTTDYKNQKVKVILVSLDMPKQVESRLIPFVQRKKIQSQVVLLDDPDANSWIPKVADEWSGAIPATVIYRNGQRKFYEKSFTYEELQTEIKQFN